MRLPADSPLIDVEALAALVAEGGVTVLDVRYRVGGPPGAAEHARGHVPGASYVDLDSALAGAPGARGRHPLPDPGDFEKVMRVAGVRQDHPVVVYDDWAGRAAARCWWLLRWAGHSDVRVLDGGWSAWVAAGQPVSDRPADPVRGDLVVRPGGMPVLARADVLGHAEREVLIDARNPERFRGDVEPLDPVAGHIPGALNVATGDNLTDQGRFRPVEELRQVYAAAAGREVAAYCGSGVTATHDILAMSLAGIDAALYPGSWSEWVADSSRPVATGD